MLTMLVSFEIETEQNKTAPQTSKSHCTNLKRYHVRLSILELSNCIQAVLCAVWTFNHAMFYVSTNDVRSVIGI